MSFSIEQLRAIDEALYKLSSQRPEVEILIKIIEAEIAYQEATIELWRRRDILLEDPSLEAKPEALKELERISGAIAEASEVRPLELGGQFQKIDLESMAIIRKAAKCLDKAPKITPDFSTNFADSTSLAVYGDCSPYIPPSTEARRRNSTGNYYWAKIGPDWHVWTGKHSLLYNAFFLAKHETPKAWVEQFAEFLIIREGADGAA
jgi:hypothetical protein